MSLRTPLGKVRGLGSAKGGTQHWWHQRLTAVALIPLSLWFAGSMIAYASADYDAAIAWVGSPSVSVLLMLLVVSVFYHAQLGLQVVVEDYVHLEWLKIASLVVIRFAILILAFVSAFAIVRVALGS